MSKKNKRRALGNKIVRRMPKVSEINLGTEIVGSPVRPEQAEEDLQPIQCANGHWTTMGDLDADKHCSQCPIEQEKDEEDALDDALDYLYPYRCEDYYDDGKD